MSGYIAAFGFDSHKAQDTKKIRVSLFLSACSKEGTSDNDAISNNGAISNENTASHVTQGREWVYVPEVITVGDERADYERMQPVGDTICYVSLGEEAANSVRNICQYSLTDRELKSVPIDWPEGGNNWDVGYRFFAQDQSLYMTANVYFPTADGRGGHLLISSDAYAIAAVSEHKEAAWNFIEDSLIREKSEIYAELWLTYPTLKKTLDERVEAAIARDKLTWDEVIKIINEEAAAYYSGQKGIDDVVSVIQNRVRLYVNENM